MSDNYLIYLAISFLIIGAITSYIKVRKDSKLPRIDYKVIKSRGYDYENPTRFFNEPLMRYIWTPMASILGSLLIFGITLSIFHNDGGKWFMSQVGTDFANYLIGIPFFIGLGFLMAYTILYFIRDWGNKEKWNMRYEDGVKKK